MLAVGASAAFAKDVVFMARPNGQTLPLFVLQAKAAEFLPEGMNVVLKPVPRTKEAVVKALKTKEVDYANVFHAMGATLHEKGMTHLKLAGVHVWGGMGILSKDSIKPGDWQALKGATMLVAPGIKTPPHKISMMALMINGINPKADLMIAGATPHQAFDQMASADNAPDFVVMPEPQLSHGLIKMKKQGWKTQYHLFADSGKAVTDFGVPLGSLWIVGDQPDAKAVVAAFDKAVDYTFDPANREEVAKIIAKGFNETFDKSAPVKVFSDALGRGLLKMNYKSAAGIEAALRIFWGNAGINPSRDVIWHGNDFKVPDKAVLVSEMLPRHVGSAIAHGKELGLSKKTMMAALRIRKDVHAVMIEHLTKVRNLEAKIFDAYVANDFDAVRENLKALADARLTASMLQIECIERTMKEYDPADLAKLRQFHIDNEKVIAAFGGL
ncbi:MAG: hypothetical protein CSA68_00300 [Rhodobacterales bacterium]|nr:MAG: hypothetical protein CSA68_00300 [Rhodobacterales bacterium]